MVLSLIRTYFLEADVGESHSSEGWAHFPPHDGAVAHVALEGGGRRRQRRRQHEEGGGEGARVESHRGRRNGHFSMLDGTMRVVVFIVTWKGAQGYWMLSRICIVEHCEATGGTGISGGQVKV